MRIIGGRVGGRTLKAPRGVSTRPTSDKVRQAIFNMLVTRGDPPAQVLDLYAGSGALGLEALSRGAGRAVFVDADGDACDLVRDNAAALGLSADVTHSPVVRWLAKQTAGAFGWIFLDPPYDSHETGELEKALELVARKQLLDAGGIVVAEHDWRHAPAERYAPLALFDRRRYGQTAVSFYRHEDESNAG
ncbi:MAG TPA: 16S rRNA (guanine(966)-N(2))-methyltransferase RsmD [Polyangia bacterium]|nr:16S rRNA (guanine(966)-N(2))-methyltransferase RsmD [Polyangia bacterium]